MGFLTGTPDKSSGYSKNVNNDLLTRSLGSTVGATGGVSDMLGSMLGLNGGEAGDAAFSKFKDSTGYNHLLQEGQRAITSNNAAKGMFQSGATGKSLVKFGTGLGDTYLKDFMGQLQDLGKLGVGAGGVLSDSGKVSSEEKKGGKKGLLGSIVGGIL